MSTTTDPSSKPATVETTAPSAAPVTSPPTPAAPPIVLPSTSSAVTPGAAAPPVAAPPAPVVAEGKLPIVGKAPAPPPPTDIAGGAVAARPPPAQPAKSTGAATKSTGASGKGSKRSKSKKQSPSVTMATAPTASQSGSTGGENTGRWTAEEHRLFLQGLDQHGKGWKKIASLIKSRTVVQIRTHAQKYFQKLAKARQNGEEGDVTMEGRGGGAILGGGGVCGSGSSGHASKKKRQLTGTKRKHISSVVSSVTTKEVKIVSVENQGAPSVAGEAQAQADPPVISKGLPSVAPALAPFIVSPSNSVDQASLTPAVLEDSLYRFLTPVTGDAVFTETVTSTPAEGASVPTPAPVSGQTTIKVPIETSAPGPGITTGETSPTSVTDITFPTFDPKEPPQWYSKGGDVDELLDEADTLDWLADSGDLEESYNLSSTKQGNSNPPPTTSEMASLCSTSDSSSEDCDHTPTVVSVRSSSQDLVCKPSVSNASITTDNGMMTLPALFEQPSQPSQPPLNKKPKLSSIANVVYSSATEAVEATLPSVASAANINDELAVFDTAFDEQAFVSALLDGSSSSNLPAATMS